MDQVKNALILGSSKGIGKAFRKAALLEGFDAPEINSSIINTLDSQSVDNFINTHNNTEYSLCVLNTGGLKPVDLDAPIALYKRSIMMHSKHTFGPFLNFYLTSNSHLMPQ